MRVRAEPTNAAPDLDVAARSSRLDLNRVLIHSLGPLCFPEIDNLCAKPLAKRHFLWHVPLPFKLVIAFSTAPAAGIIHFILLAVAIVHWLGGIVVHVARLAAR